ncbi:MAG: carboxypeptidase-like regulatory domain-containing protein [Bacteroidales bacterium]
MKRLLLITLGLLFFYLGLWSQTQEVKGVVKSKLDDQPLMGVTVVDLSSGQGVVTDLDGLFTITIPSSSKTLEFKFLGMKNKKLAVSNSMLVIMEDDAVEIGDVIVTGYGSYNRGTFTGSASSLSASRLGNIPTISVEQRLQVEMAGVQVSSTSSMPRSPSSIRIRGMGSINASNEPLYVVDRVPVLSGNFEI